MNYRLILSVFLVGVASAQIVDMPILPISAQAIDMPFPTQAIDMPIPTQAINMPILYSLSSIGLAFGATALAVGITSTVIAKKNANTTLQKAYDAGSTVDTTATSGSVAMGVATGEDVGGPVLEVTNAVSNSSTTAFEAVDGSVSVAGREEDKQAVAWRHTDGSMSSISLAAPSTLTSDYDLTWPSVVGTDGQVLTRSGATGDLDWTTPTGGGGTMQATYDGGATWNTDTTNAAMVFSAADIAGDAYAFQIDTDGSATAAATKALLTTGTVSFGYAPSNDSTEPVVTVESNAAVCQVLGRRNVTGNGDDDLAAIKILSDEADTTPTDLYAVIGSTPGSGAVFKASETVLTGGRTPQLTLATGGLSSTTSPSGNLNIKTGPCSSGVSGVMNIQTGVSTGDNSGRIDMRTGTTSTTENAASGSVDISTGASSVPVGSSNIKTSGEVNIITGTSANGSTGDIRVATGGTTFGFSTGDITIESGIATSGQSGRVEFRTGNAVLDGNNVGDIVIHPGYTTGASLSQPGRIFLIPGHDNNSGTSSPFVSSVLIGQSVDDSAADLRFMAKAGDGYAAFSYEHATNAIQTQYVLPVTGPLAVGARRCISTYDDTGSPGIAEMIWSTQPTAPAEVVTCEDNATVALTAAQMTQNAAIISAGGGGTVTIPTAASVLNVLNATNTLLNPTWEVMFFSDVTTTLGFNGVATYVPNVDISLTANTFTRLRFVSFSPSTSTINIVVLDSNVTYT